MPVAHQQQHHHHHHHHQQNQTSTSHPPTPTAVSSSATQNQASQDKPRLTEDEKKANHIASEQKRRQAIREGFDEIADLTPGMTGQGRSEALVLQSATAYMRRLMGERWRLVEEVRGRGGGVEGLGEGAKGLDEMSLALGREFEEEEEGGRR